ncbi:hypothetical protein DAPPUDRAFT_313171 [Daphnia pulex]|uniref:Uncharacterized protein n=1 Tax=Daphnia pulex TaxID=6669 RepID=E9G326_DAPPU|nr:hypothetical protein DAPPUDRAFT_313171 [Daphnia pulex]|eukprot:EFX86403.1 hypothetical protein DAPPUDRAFT_313171 [Daphnia pulex]
MKIFSLLFVLFAICFNVIIEAARLESNPIVQTDLEGSESIPYGRYPSRNRGHPYLGTRHTHHRVVG